MNYPIALTLATSIAPSLLAATLVGQEKPPSRVGLVRSQMLGGMHQGVLDEGDGDELEGCGRSNALESVSRHAPG